VSSGRQRSAKASRYVRAVSLAYFGFVEGGGFLWVRRGWFLAADFFLRAVDFFFFAGAGSSFVADTRLEWRGR